MQHGRKHDIYVHKGSTPTGKNSVILVIISILMGNCKIVKIMLAQQLFTKNHFAGWFEYYVA